MTDPNTSNQGCGCGCGHDTNPTDERDLGLKDVHADGESCGCGNPGTCQCGHHGADKDFTNPDTVNPDGTNPAVTTVEKAEGYKEGAGWNDGIAPQESAHPQSYEKDDKNVN